MSCVQNWVCCHRNRQLIISLLILLASNFTQERFMAEGRLVSKLVGVVAQTYKGREEMVVMRNQIGSRPPRCQRRCSSCGHCEAVQVPIVPQLHSHRTSHFYAAPTVEYSRGDYISNYKPMTWKCKCGNAIFNP
ncbi:hypothetical protein VitviT2T_027392 [Vitis vinifera]|uniref:Epidermal patterning factor-like protein n=2 Tax=Vitis vinifera TaxID=29760 RepID=A0A438KMR9_VITVI|nr:EPIDERMAL PATTERNING FACTOR-like protein 2 [Vitis vinifera]RVX22500.1 Epidermal patterning factor-like protein 2 [Vitis vinifera]WKA09772.1 hypothetical protein VitviT2T_027392 [Vitis vinifera]